MPRDTLSNRRAIAVGIVGNTLEWYDFGVYGYLASTLSKLFFPKSDPASALLASLAVFGVGFVTRPLGAIIFGAYADRHGRRKALAAISVLMALSTAALGLLPTYATAGLLAPALLVAVRLLQGVAVGGEAGGSTSYLVEFAPAQRRGFFGSFQLLGVALGFLLGSLFAAFLNSAMGPTARLAWGWRVPFLCGIAVGFVGAYLRFRLSDTPQYAGLEARGTTSAAPLAEALRGHARHIALIFGAVIHSTVAYYMTFVYLGTHLVTVGKIPQATALWIGSAGLALFVAILPALGMLSDRVGRRPLLLASSAGSAAFAFPIFHLASSGSVALGATAQVLMVLLYAPAASCVSAFQAEILPTRIRATGMALGGSLSISLFGGFSPFIAASLVQATGSPVAPAAYAALAAVASGLLILRTPETAFAPLS